MSSCDSSTPIELWQEYESCKRALRELTRTPREYEGAIAWIARALGLGVPPTLLTPAQRRTQEAVIRRRRNRCAR